MVPVLYRQDVVSIALGIEPYVAKIGIEPYVAKIVYEAKKIRAESSLVIP